MRVLDELSCGRFRLTRHAIERMRERGVSTGDICHVGRTGRVISTIGDRFWVRGLDIDGEELTVIAVVEFQAIIVTVF